MHVDNMAENVVRAGHYIAVHTLEFAAADGRKLNLLYGNGGMSIRSKAGGGIEN